MTPARTSSVSTRSRVGATATALTVMVGLLFAACGPAVDEDFPPGDPTLAQPGDNPVLGSDGPGAAFIAEADTTNYGLLALLAVCLIAAGVLLVKVEAWERRRSAARDQD